MAAKYAQEKSYFTEDVFAADKSLYAATKFDNANVGHDPDEDFLKKSWQNETFQSYFEDFTGL